MNAASPPVEGEIAAMVARLRGLRGYALAWQDIWQVCDDAADMLTRLATPAADCAEHFDKACAMMNRVSTMPQPQGAIELSEAIEALGAERDKLREALDDWLNRAALAGTTTQSAAMPPTKECAPGPSKDTGGSAADPIMEQHGESLIMEWKQNATTINEAGGEVNVAHAHRFATDGRARDSMPSLDRSASPQGIPLDKSEQRMLKRALFASAATINEAATSAAGSVSRNTRTPDKDAPEHGSGLAASPQDDALIARLYQFAVAVDASRAGLLDWSSADCAKLIDALETAAARLSGAKAKGSDGETYAANL